MLSTSFLCFVLSIYSLCMCLNSFSFTPNAAHLSRRPQNHHLSHFASSSSSSFANSITTYTTPSSRSTRDIKSSLLSTSTATTTSSSSSTISPSSPLIATTTSSSSSTSPSPLIDCLIIGSGLTGSTTAFNLLKHDITNILLAEKSPTFGGNVITRTLNTTEGEFLWEEGPNSFQPTNCIMKMTKELGLDKQIVFADSSLSRFIYWEGQGSSPRLASLHALPTNGPLDLLTFDLLTFPGKLRAISGAMGMISDPPKPPYEESIKEFITRHLGEEAFDRIIDPFISGVYAGDGEELGMRSALPKINRLEGLGSFGTGLISGMVNRIKELSEDRVNNPVDPAWPVFKSGELGSYKRGISMFTDTIRGVLGEDRVKMEYTLVNLVREDENESTSPFIATFDTPDGRKEVKAKSVYITSPAHATSKIIGGDNGDYKALLPNSSKLLKEIYYPPVVAVTLALKKTWFKELPGGTPAKPLKGFGHLIPRKMHIRSLGCIWGSSLFENRCPEDWEIVLSFIGGARDKDILKLSESEIVEQVKNDVKWVLLRPDIDVKDIKLLGYKVWPLAIPQYNKGHMERMEAIKKEEKGVPGVFLGGNWKTGVAVGDCVEFGTKQAGVIADFLKRVEKFAV